MTFENNDFLWLILLVLPLVFVLRYKKSGLEGYFSKDVLQKMRHKHGGLSKRSRNILLLLALLLAVVAFARPVIHKGEIKVNSSTIDVMVGFDISQSMFAEDVYPNRFEFAKQKFDSFLKEMTEAKIGVVGFSSQAFLISPLTKDIGSLKFLVKNMQFDNMSLKGTDIHAVLEVTNDLLTENKKKALFLFTDGGDKSDYRKEIAYAKEQGILLFVYAIGTQKGGIIKTDNGVLKDKNGDIVVVKRNEAIKHLAIESGGAYLEHSMSSRDIKILTQNIKSKFKATQKNEQVIKDTQELFVYPLGLSFLFLFLSFSSLPRRVKV